MARPSKIKSPKHAKFAVFEDAVDSSIPTPDPSRQPSADSKEDVEFDSELDVSEYVQDKKHLEDIAEDVTPSSLIGEQTDTEIENNDGYNGEGEDRRESSLTRGTSISSLPESSVFDTDYDESMMEAMHIPYTHTRPTFRRPAPFERSSPRRLALRAKSRTGMPRSAKQGPRPRTSEMDEEKDFPLVLLHVTLLPVELRWSAENMLEVLPPKVIENLQLLRSKVSETILHRGILIPHPREEYELLEERLLEALELKKERLTKCGHYRARDSTSSTSSGEGSVKSADSGVAFNLGEPDWEQCTTCNSPVKGMAAAVDSNGGKWSIKVFAANGLMRAPAWSAAWSEMESVDVEILPWINESLRKQLDTLAEREEEDERRRREDDSAHIKEVVEEQVRIAHEERKRRDAEEHARQVQDSIMPPEIRQQAVERPTARPSDLPQVYRTADIPLSMLLKNYIFLLAQDRRNIAMFALAMLVFWMSLSAAVSHPSILDLEPIASTCDNALPQMAIFEPENNTAIARNTDIHDALLNVSIAPEEARDSTGPPTKQAPSVPDIDDVLQQYLPSSVVESTKKSIRAETIQPMCWNYDLARTIFDQPMSLTGSSNETNVI